MSATQEVHPSVSKTPIAVSGSDLPTICVLCSHNCGVRVTVEDGKITKVRGDASNPITQGYICNKAVTIDKYANHKQRVEYPMRRQADGTFERISWETATTEIGEKLAALRNEHGPRSLGLVGIGGQGNHLDAPYASSFLRATGSRRWYNAFAQEKTQHMLVDQWMFDAPPTTFYHPDVDHATYLIVMGTNPRISNRGHNATETFRDLSKRESCTVVVLDPRETETTRGADQHVRVQPGSDAYFLLGMAATLVQRELYDVNFVSERTAGFNDIRDELARIDVGEMAERCGIAKDEITTIATDFAKSEASSIMFDLGVEQTPFSTLVSYLIHLNSVLTGHIGKKGTNGFIETFLPPTLSPGRHKEPERALASGIQAVRALGNAGMFSPTLVPEEVMIDHPERIRALIVEGSNPILSFSDANAWREAIDRLDLLVVVEPAFTETCRLADYVLPTPVGYEKWETALFPKRHPEIDVQVRPPILAGPVEALPEAEIYARIGEAMGIIAPLPEELAEIAKPETPEARAAFLGTAMGMLGDLAAKGLNGDSHVLFWGYRAMGHHFPAPSLTAIFASSIANAMERRDSVLRAVGPEWADKDPFALGEEIFKRILDHPEGVTIAIADDTNSVDQYMGFEDKKIRVAPPAMVKEMKRALATHTDHAEYPFVLASGLRTRWTANTIQRDPTWRKGQGPHCALHLHPDDAAKLSVEAGDSLRIETVRGAIVLPAAFDPKLQPGHVWMPNGFGVEYSETIDGERVTQGANLNEITDAADRDPITGCPHHRYVPVKLTRVAPETKAA
ncbi:MAG: molybdopterin-dependent oxidoreductase [Candidatus Binatia bacterium]|nr:molybdopterin-dependent oxidoreductase [Candidatus Binatia bacterium]